MDKKEKEFQPVTVKSGAEYVLRPAANCDLENPYLYAQLVTSFEASDNPPKKGRLPVTQIEAYKDPQDFARQLTEMLVMQIKDELIERGLMEAMKITLLVEYEQIKKE